MVIADQPFTSQPATSLPPSESEGGRHLCLIYEDDPAEQLPALLPFFREGLDRGERCIYIADDSSVDDLRRAMSAYGIDVDTALDRGALLLWTREQWRQPGALESAKKADQVRTVIDETLAAGFSGVRFAVEMTWILDPDIPPEALRHWEATINTIFTPDVPARIFCQYSRRRLAPAALHAGLSTHPVAVLGEELCANPYYDAPLLLDGETPPPIEMNPVRVDWMISQLRWARALAAERERSARAEALLQEADRSRARIQELYELAEKAAAELRNGVAVKDEFLGLLSHELKTPVTTIRGNAEILLRSGGLIDAADRDLALADIAQEAERLQRMIDNLLVLARLEAGQELETEPALVRRIVEALVTEHRRKYPHRHIETLIRAPLTPVLLHRESFEQVLRNLLSNAEKYSPAHEPIEIRITRDERWLDVSVLDRGPGIAPDETDRIFTAFYRSPRTASRAAGAGIGLVVCRRLMEAQGGTITVSARHSGGSCFTLRFPSETALVQDTLE